MEADGAPQQRAPRLIAGVRRISFTRRPSTMNAKRLSMLGVVCLLPLLYGAFAPSPPEGDVWVAMRPLLRVPLSEFQQTRRLVTVIEPRYDETWLRIVKAWQNPRRERETPGFIVFAGHDRWVHPFTTLGIAVRVTQDGRNLGLLPVINGVYRFSRKSIDWGVHFSPFSNSEIRVDITLEPGRELPEGELILAPDWGLGMKDQVVGAMADDSIRHWAPSIAVVGVALILAGAILINRLTSRCSRRAARVLTHQSNETALVSAGVRRQPYRVEGAWCCSPVIIEGIALSTCRRSDSLGYLKVEIFWPRSVQQDAVEAHCLASSASVAGSDCQVLPVMTASANDPALRAGAWRPPQRLVELHHAPSIMSNGCSPGGQVSGERDIVRWHRWPSDTKGRVPRTD